MTTDTELMAAGTPDPRLMAAGMALAERYKLTGRLVMDDARAALAAADAVDPLRQPGHRVEITEDCWTLQHPPECRANMLACPMNDAMRSMGLNGVPEGVFSVELTEDGSLFFPDGVIT